MQPAVNRRRAAIGSVRGARVDVVMGMQQLAPKGHQTQGFQLIAASPKG
jgi:hypothetical protein